MVSFVAFMTLEGEIFSVINEELKVLLQLMGIVRCFPTFHIVSSSFEV